MTNRQKIFGVIGAVLLFFAAAEAAWAATYYVATTGSDSNPGTLDKPFRTIAKGSQRMAGGDTLYIRAGTYSESMMHGVRGFVFQNGTASAYTRYAAYEGEQVIVKPPPAMNAQSVVYFSPRTKHIEVSGMVLDGSNVELSTIRGDANRDHSLQASYNRLLRNDIMGTSKHSIIWNTGPNEFIGNRIHGSKAYGIYTKGSPGLIEGNAIYDNAGYGITIYDFGPISGWVIRNNIIFRNGDNYYPSYAPYNGVNKRRMPAVNLTSGGHQFYNNLVYDNPNGGVELAFNGAKDTLAANNTIYGNGKFGIFSKSRNARIINNIVWGNSGAQIQDQGTGTVLQNNLTTNPNFVNPAAGDFGLQAGSPAIDKGTTLAQVPTDFTGKARPDGAAYDIGAFEGAGSRADVLPGMGGGLPAGVGGGGYTIPGLGNCFQY